MTFPILGGNGAVDGAFSIDNSLRLNQSDNPRLTRTPSSQGNPRTFTFSCWAKKSSNGTRQVLFGADIPSQANASYVRFTDDDTLQAYFDYGNNTLEANLNSVAKFRDVSAFYHVVWATDTSLSTEADRIKLYVNGVQITDFQSPDYISQNFGTDINQTHPHYVGTDTVGVGNDLSLGGYLADVHFIDGQQLSPTDFGEFDSDSGIWKPKAYSGSYGSNGFKLDFSNSSNFGEDFSGNDNDFTATNLASTDQTTDTPTNNFATMNPLGTNNLATHSEGNTKLTTGDGASISGATIAMTNGKWYAEFICTAKTSVNMNVGIVRADTFDGDNQMDEGNNVGYMYQNNGNIFHGGADESYGASWAVNDVIGIAFNADNLNVEFFKNGVGQGNYTRIASENSGGNWLMCVGEGQGGATATFECNFGNPPSAVSSGNSDDNEYGNFEYAPPSGYLALCTQNLATELSPTIDDGSAYFHTQLYTGNRSSSQTITNDASAGDFQPDWVWIKQRNDTVAHSHVLFDSTRGVTKGLASNLSEAEYTSSSAVTSFNTDGFSIGNGASVNQPDRDVDYVAWQWKANGGTTSSNTDGSITSTVQANTTAGFSIVTYTSASGSQTVGHGLGKSLDMYIIKERTTSGDDWFVYHSSLGAGAKLRLSGTSASSSDTSIWNNTEPTTTVFSVGNDQGGVNQNTGGNQDYVAYCFAEIEGYSSINSYTGNGSTDGTFVYTGFRPAWVLRKCSTAAEQWHIQDTKRLDFNNDSNSAILIPSTSAAEATNTNLNMDILSNGFKTRSGDGAGNGDGRTYVYMAFAENPFSNSNGIPVTAR